LLGRLGEGSQGIVFLARDQADGARVAIKLLHALLSENDASRARFLQEVTAAKRVPAFCTAQLLDADMAGTRPYIVSEYIPGPSLEAVVRSEGPRGGTALGRIAVNTATALAGIHQAGVVHRDFKAANVLLGPDGPVVIDFGIAKALDAVDSRLTLPGHAAGTPGYMAPDQFEDGVVGPPVDIFAWGVTMAFAATGKLPFGTGPTPAVIYRILNEAPRLDGLTPSLQALVSACLDKDPAARPDARQIVDHLLGREDFGGSPAPGTWRSAAGARAAQPAGPAARTGEATPARDPSTTPLLDPASSLDATPSLDVTPPVTVDPIRAVQMRQPSQQFDFGKPPAPAAARSRRRGRVPLWATIAAVAVLACGGAVAAKAVGGSPAHKDSSLSDDTSALPAVSASGTSPASPAGKQAKPAKRGSTGTGGAPVPSSSSRPAAGGTTVATTATRPPASKSAPPGGPSAPASSPVSGATPTTASTPKPPSTPSSPAKATPNPYTAAEVCGSGYSVLDSHALSGGTVYLLWSNSTGKNCVATMRSQASGKIAIKATLKVEGGSTGSDSGSYTYYAGPVALKATATCVEWGGSIASSSWTSGWSHCS
jgi:serine/threonine protein kinase